MPDATPDGGHEPAGNVPRRVRTTGTRKEDWIGDQFRRVYDDALEDSIPTAMLDLLNAIDDEDKPEGGSTE